MLRGMHAMRLLPHSQAVESTKPDGFTPKVVKQEKEYL